MRWIRSAVPLAALVSLSVLAVAPGASRASEPPKTPAPARAERKPEPLVQASLPPLDPATFPCSQCHTDKEPDRTRRELAFHDEIQGRFSHDAEHRWCLDCHDAGNRDVLHLSNGEPVPFTESYRLCGQCHGDKYRDWRAGVHGKRVGRWDGEKTYFLCVSCHDPHAPAFKAVKPMPRPRRPEENRK
jgi:hypothetical protein